MVTFAPHRPLVQPWSAAAALTGLLLISTGLAAAVHRLEHGHAPAEHHNCPTCQFLGSVKQEIPPASAAPAVLELSRHSWAPAWAEPAPLSRLSGGDKSARGPPALS